MFNFEYQKARSRLYNSIRNFFDERDYLEVFTPSLSPTLIPEPTIKNFSSRFENEFVGSRDFYLIPSPEIFMKELLASGSPSIYQLSTCFRNSEQLGEVHNPEFTMLEYYTLGFDEKDSIALTEELISAVAFENTPSSSLPPFEKLSVAEATMKYSGVDLDKVQEYPKLRAAAEKLGLYVPEAESWDDTFNRIFVGFVEPGLTKEHPVLLYDYPEQIDCLAGKIEGRPYRKRWEAYIGGIETANCYSEETDKKVTATYYEKEYGRLLRERKGTNDVIPSVSSAFPKLDIPVSSGVAIGVDRLLAALLGLGSIEPLLLFPFAKLMGEN
jgi:Truncated, possibly inactive, lysyl-tRNA synthetase (class II)